MLWQIINGLAVGLVIAYLGLALFAIFFSDGMIFPAQPATYSDTKEHIKLPTKSGREVTALYLPNPEATFTMLYSHGNAEDLGDIRPTLERLHSMGFSIMAYDYPGYGTSEGRPTEQGSLQAAAAAFSYLVTQRDVEPNKIILFGRSLGSGPSCWLAAREPVAGLILDGAFSSTFRIVTKIPLLPWDKFDNLAAMDAIDCPTLFIHGKLDRVVPFAHAEALYAAAPDPKTSLFIAEAGHNNLIECAGERYWDAIRTFTESLQKTPNE